MKKKEITIQLDSGLDTRPVALLVQVASQFRSDIHLESGNTRVNAKSIMGMMTLGLVTGEEVTVTANGEDEQQAMEEIEAYLTKKS
ncbi:MAG TPA: HPr family phosphocarrier protein [Lachnospiraceae bacterium]|nr:HPr family phosphocarrier protein [Lachnospiraceae bacterium]